MSEKEPLFTADHHGFYLKGEPFLPLIQDLDSALDERANTIVIRLPAGLQDDLDWTQALAAAKEQIAAKKFLLWEIDLGLDTHVFEPHDTAAFFSFTLALEQFKTAIWPHFSAHTFGVVLYRGAFRPEHSFPLQKWETSYLEWKEEKKYAPYSLYAAQTLADYLHRLVSFLPDEVLPFATFDISSIASSAEAMQLFSSERFAHTHLIVKGARYPFMGIAWNDREATTKGWLGEFPNVSQEEDPSIGVYLPQDEMMDSTSLHQLEILLNSLKERQISFRIVPEEKLTEQWDGLDTLIVIPTVLSIQGQRKLLGFKAAGGSVVSFESLF